MTSKAALKLNIQRVFTDKRVTFLILEIINVPWFLHGSSMDENLYDFQEKENHSRTFIV